MDSGSLPFSLVATLADMPPVPPITLNNGVEIPQVGFGVFLVPADETRAAVSSALEIGYRHIDTAALYGNEAEVGAAIADSGIDRADLFVTTKCWNTDQGFEESQAACAKSLDLLQMAYVDLYLIHWPRPKRDRYVDTWRGFERLYETGASRAIGVSNFQPAHLQRLLDECEVVPAVNQVELHPRLQQAELRAFHERHGIVTEAWSPLARGDLLDDATIAKIAAKHNVSSAQVILRWHLDLGNVIIPKSVNPDRMAGNIDLFSIRLDAEDHEGIAALDAGRRIGPDPEQFNR
jgi:2,5-diketo-D-gluconate reductase A